MPDDQAIRNAYADMGVDAFYQTHGATYRNPHEDAIGALLREVAFAWQLDLSRVLDLACGSGEATLSLRELGAHVEGADPYTGEAYRERTGQTTRPLSFEQIAGGALEGEEFSLVVCSFALHLAEPSRLPMLCLRLAQISPALLILTPHKRPAIFKSWGWSLSHEIVAERVRARFYQSSIEAEETSAANATETASN